MISGRNSELEISRIIENGDFFVKIWGGDVDFWGENEDGRVNLRRVGVMGKIETFENV